ncbi:adhesion G-protein coupled receptor G2-like [Amphiura filiformis]|uniref:adhesion G-protein coupled receptor G2-like n=1 Tax=Amphiura filiformis TaxID=82378 RepID=UPI003B212DF3
MFITSGHNKDHHFITAEHWPMHKVVRPYLFTALPPSSGTPSFELVLLRTISGKILINLCMSLLGMNLVFMIEAIPSAVNNVSFCRALAIGLHYFTLSTFLWMGTEAVQIHQTLIKVFGGGRTNRFMAKCMFVSWGVPIIPVAIVAGIDITLYTAENGCMLSKNNALVYYLSYMAPCIIILVANFIIFFMVLHAICACRPKHTVHSRKGIRRTQVGCAISVTFLLGLTWVFSLLKIGSASLAFHYIFTIVNSLLGFFIFLFRCALNPEAIRNWIAFCNSCSKDTSTYGSDLRNNVTTQRQKKTTVNDSGNYTDEYAQINPNFFGDTFRDRKGTNTVLLSVVSQSNKHFNAIDTGSVKQSNIKPDEKALANLEKENQYEFIT